MNITVIRPTSIKSASCGESKYLVKTNQKQNCKKTATIEKKKDGKKKITLCNIYKIPERKLIFPLESDVGLIGMAEHTLFQIQAKVSLIVAQAQVLPWKFKGLMDFQLVCLRSLLQSDGPRLQWKCYCQLLSDHLQMKMGPLEQGPFCGCQGFLKKTHVQSARSYMNAYRKHGHNETEQLN